MGARTSEPNLLAQLTPRERQILSLMFGAPLTGGGMRILTEGLDVDRENPNDLLMLACLGYARGWEHFPSEIVPRLKGLHRYYQVSNMLGLRWLTEKLRALRGAGIPVMLLKGLALRFHYAPGIPRLMNDFDIAVPEERYSEASALLHAGDGDSAEVTSPHHGRVIGPGRVLELHRWIFKNHGERGTDIWERAISIPFQGMDVCVPCPQDMFIHQLDNRSRDVFAGIFQDRRLQWLCDCRRIADAAGGLEIDSIAARAGEFRVTLSMRHMLLCFADCFPALLDRPEVERAFPATAEYRRWVRRGNAFLRCELRFLRHRYGKESAFTPLHICRSLRRKILLYRVNRCERRAASPRYSFWDFLKEEVMVDSLGELVAKYAPRLRLFARGGES